MKTPFLLSLLTLILLVPAAHSADPASGDPAEKAWMDKLSKSFQKSPAFAYVKEDPKLPRVLIIGDSISIGYTPVVRQQLQGVANVLRIPANAMDTENGLAKLEEWLGTGPWAVIHFNWGLHDLKHMKGGKMDLSVPVQVTPEAYEQNLRKLVARLKQTKAKLIWATITPVPPGSDGRRPEDVPKYNELATKVMKGENIAIDDLNTAVTPKLAELQLPKNVHYSPEGYQFLGEQVTAQIKQALGSK